MKLLERFDRLAEAPGAVPRLRRFILDLAVRGKLVKQDPSEGSAGEQNREASETGAANVPFVIPRTWKWFAVGDVGDARLGKMLDRAKNHGTPKPYLRNLNVRWFDFDLSDLFKMRFQESELEEFELRPGDVLVCEGGEPGRAAVWDGRASGVYFQKAIHRVRFAGQLDPMFFVINLRAASQDGRLADHFTGVGIRHLTGRGLAAVSIPVPPLAEQRRIVAKVDELMVLCDRLEAAQAERERRRGRVVNASLATVDDVVGAELFRDNLQCYVGNLSRMLRPPANVRGLRQSILAAAVRGRLVPQNPSEGSAIASFNHLRATLAEHRRSAPSRVPRAASSEPSHFFANGTFPDSWVLSTFDKLTRIVSGVAKGKDLRGVRTVTCPYLRVANVQRGYLNLGVIKEIEVPPEDIDRYRLEQGDVLMTEGGDWDKLGRAAVWNCEVPRCIHQNHIYRIRSPDRDALMPVWIALFANSPLGRSYFEGASKQTTNLASINMTQLRNCPLPLPPAAEQRRIVAKVDELMTVCDRLEAQLKTVDETGRRALDAVLRDALAGADSPSRVLEHEAAV
ncbi:MAG: restriction endonuclease subunit S [Vicinamibacterales bacterium]